MAGGGTVMWIMRSEILGPHELYYYQSIPIPVRNGRSYITRRLDFDCQRVAFLRYPNLIFTCYLNNTSVSGPASPFVR